MSITNKFFLLLLLVAVTVTSCDDDDPPMENEEELITTVILTFDDPNSSEDITFEWKDLDGDGGDDPIVTVSDLDSNVMYSVSIMLLNEQKIHQRTLQKKLRKKMTSINSSSWFQMV